MGPQGSLNRVLAVMALVLLACAVLQELLKPAVSRAWNGTLFGFVPYDLRLPTADRIRDAYWNPEDSRVLTPHVIGVGWSVNLPALFAKIRQARSLAG